jgi:hypothetical protein
MAMTLISTTTVGAGGVASITFSSIPADYTDLLLVLSGRSTAAPTLDSPYFTLNSTGSSGIRLEGTGSTVGSYSTASNHIIGYLPAASTTSNTFGNISMLIPNYAASAAKVILIDGVMENNASSSYSTVIGARCANTSPVTTLSLTGGSGNFAQYTVASLYGITKGSGGATVS